MPQVYICNRCAEKIDTEKQDWVVLSIDTSGSSGIETHAHADCEVERLKVLRKNGLQPLPSSGRGLPA